MSIRIQGTGHGANLLTELNRCRLSNDLCDVVLRVGGHSFPAHRVVLVCAASFFRRLFSSGRGASSFTFTLDLAPANFEKLLDFIYTAEVVTDITNVGMLYELAQRLGVHELVRTCQATFPNLRGSGSSPGEQVVDLDLDLGFTPSIAEAASACDNDNEGVIEPVNEPVYIGEEDEDLEGGAGEGDSQMMDNINEANYIGEEDEDLEGGAGGGACTAPAQQLQQCNGAPALLRCSLCPHEFHSTSSFQLHLSQHASKPFQCKVCLRLFHNHSTIRVHLKMHAGALMYHCTVYFPPLKLVSSHMERHKDCLPSNFRIEQTFMYNNHSKEPIPSLKPSII
ncbi:hypothetical protein AAFF_G00367690 [Aldrovandia affinis]|uniref:Uncharacterized protein n=1 Tax=Aldrovandia affinis TaxID=143900 RepID=A0AAD7R4P2_9TELE|nr:hypothetical protein AAFF_G00367690 [Aldrovandia affinis]